MCIPVDAQKRKRVCLFLLGQLVLPYHPSLPGLPSRRCNKTNVSFPREEEACEDWVIEGRSTL